MNLNTVFPLPRLTPKVNAECWRQTRNSTRYRSFRLRQKQYLADINSSIVDMSSDVRPYAYVTLLGKSLSGLMDTGASISCLGGKFASELNHVEYKPLKLNIRTADGAKQAIVGKITTDILFRGESKRLCFYIVPSLSQDLYLGIDFWIAFDLLPLVLTHKTHCTHVSAVEIPDSLKIPLTDQQQNELIATIKLFPSFTEKGLGKTTWLFHDIDVTNCNPIKQRHYAVSPAVEKLMYDELDRMLALGVIEESDSPWSSPIVLVQKPGKVRLCLDSRKVNEVTVKNAYPMPLIDGILSRLPRAEYITSIDLKDAYWQIPLTQRAREKTAFTVPGRPLYQFKVMPFGLTNAPQTMSKLMDTVIPPSLRHEIFVYLDDLLVISESFEKHIAVLKQLASRLALAGLTINVEKSKFCLKEVKYLGHVIGHGTIQTDPDKVAAIKDFPVPRSIKQVRRFLGTTGWYHKFINNYAGIAAPISDTLKSRKKFEWSEEAQKAFTVLKEQLCKAPVLHSPDFTLPFAIHCDASHTGVGGVLMQKDSDGNEVPIAFMSRKLNKCQRNYSVTEKECLAAIMCVKKFRAYIEGHEFAIITDHASLKWLMSQTDLSTRLARWALKLQAFSFKIYHRKGSKNIVPDALSRVYTEDLSELSLDCSIDLKSLHFNTKEYVELKDRILGQKVPLPDVKIIDNIIYRRSEHATGEQIADDMCWKLWIPRELVTDVLKQCHEHPLASHNGIGKTLERVRRYYYWPNLVGDVKAFINNCATCKCSKHPNKPLRPPLSSATNIQRVFQKLFIDFLGPYPRSRTGHIGICVVVDYMSKYPFLKPVKKLTADAIIRFLEEEIFHCFGVPETVLSDNGVQFKSQQFNALLQKYGVQHSYTAMYAPQANASERVNRSVLAAIKAYINPEQSNWDEQLSHISCALRSGVHSAVKSSPYRIAFGQHMITDGSTYTLLRSLKQLDDRTMSFNREDSFDLIRQAAKMGIEQQHTRNEKYYNTRSNLVSYVVGQEVYRRNFQQSNFAKGYSSKLGPAFVKARIRNKYGTCYYELEDLQGKLVGKYHAKDIKQ